jgi:hypothetical protein
MQVAAPLPCSPLPPRETTPTTAPVDASAGPPLSPEQMPSPIMNSELPRPTSVAESNV